MLSNELHSKLVSFFDLDRDVYRQSHSYIGIDEDKCLIIKETAQKAIKTISFFTENNGYVSVNENNVTVLWECINALHTCMYPRNSWHRESSILLIYQFLSNFHWSGKPAKYIGFDGWGPLIYDLSPEQLTYYLWWRKESKNGIFHEATGEYLWLYIYDIVLNTCYDEPNQSLLALRKLYDTYEHLSPTVTHKRLSRQKLGYFIVNYALYNGLTLDINELFKTYGVDDKFDIYHRISCGCFKGVEQHLLSLASSTVKSKTFENSDEKLFVLSIIAEVFEQICKISKNDSVNFLGDICGTLNDHVLWKPYESPVLSARSAKETVESDKHISFAIGDNTYIYATSDLSSDVELANNNYSFYYNDDGNRFHCKGFYYRKEYSGPNENARLIIDYIIRRIQISYRVLAGGRTIKELFCPYKNIKSNIDDTIFMLVQQYYPIWKQSNKSTTVETKLQYKVLKEDQTYIPLKFKYKINTVQHSEASTKREGESFMSEIKKATLLQKRFDILKNQYSQKSGDSGVLYTLSEKIIVPMLELDFEAGCNMWEYELSHYYEKCYPVDYNILTDHIVEHSETKILAKVFRNNENIKKYVFLLDPYENHLYCEWFIRDLILIEEYDLANELITLYSQNDRGDNNPKENLYSLLYQAVNSSESNWKITSAGIDFLNQWIKKIQSKAKRAELEVALLSLIDCVEGNASKGPMPFSMFKTEGGRKMFMEERLKMRNARDTQDSFSELVETRTKKSEIKSLGIQSVGEHQERFQKQGKFDNEELQASLIELNSLIGLQEVKAEISSLINLMQIRRIRAERGMKVPDTSQHLVFSGNPGTGKTTVARIVGKLYHALGFLSKGHLVEVDRSALVAGYVGQTAIKTQEVIQSAMGGILFIDEAYSLSSECGENDFGQEAINTILKAMEDYRDDFVVIVAGYDNLMPRFINSNPGLKSRFNKYIFFPDYNGTDLYSIFKMFGEKNDYIVNDDAAELVAKYLDYLYKNRDENFGNARVVRNLFEKAIANQANRLMNNKLLSDDIITRITAEDVQSIIT